MTDDRMQGDKLLCEIYKSSRKEEMYLYVDKRRGLAEVPEALLERFGKPVPAMTLVLTPEKTLARAKASDIMAGIRDKGYYLQLPPAKEAYLLDLYRTPTEARY
ncbi:YcgL domain-containing protein [Halomonas sp. MCCC 1A17488]|uniref:YcgL domain-containing protein HNO51_07335 n=1 Tax=Billgrantia sulfidoxydans TaxID=2733484 RepID=A0ABX7W4H5_9GAMM|nr:MULTISPECIES: YcgL domain-containing protein [Halomonas]MCE8015724.1 YcgL domain-containing protein [Halomonas sp. MCCC 1A17488]MCG3239057.1 YcgL domain-containing protein [Halomonas sp. MCCC 1A17488]QPP50994.1 YcgL domain-containing protein [Halomonas sp. SS10-MC5]QTP54507.1 YcgL domain-containing protein [Halomonas sulfidoxydans]